MRLDKFLSEQEDISRERAAKFIKAGLVEIDGKVVTKPSLSVADSKVTLLEKPTYVGRGYFKIKDAAETFKYSFKDKRVLDVGASTGGFTQYVLEDGAKEVVAVDVGRDQLVDLIKNNPKVISMEKTNIKNLDPCAIGKFDAIVVDLSFISLSSVLEKISSFLQEDGEILCLVKPQFELGSNRIGPAGIVKKFEQQIESLEGVVREGKKLNLGLINIKVSGILGGKGNIEFFVLFSTKEDSMVLDKSKLKKEIKEVRLGNLYV